MSVWLHGMSVFLTQVVTVTQVVLTPVLSLGRKLLSALKIVWWVML
jgi:hypothetical protein